jgi:hypothetical protein
MSTSATTNRTTTNRPRVWLVAGGHVLDPPTAQLPAVRDTRGHTWLPGDDGLMHTATGYHHASWTELRARYDLVEVA